MKSEYQYAGFWIRTGAALIDTVLWLIILVPLLSAIYGADYWNGNVFPVGIWDFMFGYILPAATVITFWVYKSATPGKMVTKLSIIDAQTGGTPLTGQFIGRYCAYFVSTLPLGLGLFWVAFDTRKQGWHDKLAGTLVVRD